MTEHNLDYKTDISEETTAQMVQVRAAAMVLEKQIAESCIDCRETSLAYTKLEESLMWAVKSLAVHGHEVPAGEPVELTEEMAKDIFGDEIK